MSRRASDLLTQGSEALRSAGIPDGARDARILLCRAIGCSRAALAGNPDRAPTEREAEKFDDFISLRCAHKPVAQIIGYREFWGRKFRVTPAVLDPRPETETLVETALSGPAPRRILDLGTGTGCLAITLLAEFPMARAVAVDISPAALDLARENASEAGVIGRLELICCDWFARVGGMFDLIVSNPPYVSVSDYEALSPDVRNWEPPTALLAGADGLDAYREISSGISDHLAAAGAALMEIGAGQAASVTEIFTAGGFRSIDVIKDLDGRARVVKIRQ